VADPLDVAVGTVVAAARAAWPALAFDRGFAEHVQSLLADEADPTVAAGELVAGELYLAFACARGDGAAITIFDHHYLREVGAYVARTDPDPAFADEVRQLMRHRLLVGEYPKIATYSGRGPLGAWLRTVAVRTAIELVRARKPHTELDEQSPALRGPDLDPELDYMKTRYAAIVGQAFGEVLAALPQRQRNILRLYFLESLTIEAIAQVYNVHRMTVSRWLASWREEILAATQRLLRERLHVSPDELASLLRLVQTRIDLSIRRHLS